MSQVSTYGTEEGVVPVASDGIRCRARVSRNEGRYLDGELQEMLVRLIMVVMGLRLTNIVTVIILSPGRCMRVAIDDGLHSRQQIFPLC